MRALQLHMQKYINSSYEMISSWTSRGSSGDAGNSAKCQKHGLSLQEIESVFSDRVLIVFDKGNSDRERRFRAIGFTESGRGAFVVFTRRDGLIRPISARYMHKKEIVRYEKDNSEL